MIYASPAPPVWWAPQLRVADCLNLTKRLRQMPLGLPSKSPHLILRAILDTGYIVKIVIVFSQAARVSAFSQQR